MQAVNQVREVEFEIFAHISYFLYRVRRGNFHLTKNH